jgi:hypothetical protein
VCCALIASSLIAPLPARSEPLAPGEIEARRAALHDAGTVETTAQARALIQLAAGAEAALLPEVGRAIAPIGERAVPALIEARGPAQSPATQAWASDELDLLGKRTPADAVQTGDRDVLCGVLRAYGETRDVDALPAVLSFIAANRSEVRAAARESVLAYGDLALRRLREAFAARTGERAPEDVSSRDLAYALFDACDRERLRSVDALFDRGLAAQREGRAVDAIAAFDGALAEEPSLPRAGQAAPAYVDYAVAIARSDPSRATASLRKALRLDATGDVAGRARSELAVLEGRELRDRGVDDASPFALAVALDPKNEEAKEELARARSRGATSRAAVRRGATLAVIAGVALGLLGALRMTRARRA